MDKTAIVVCTVVGTLGLKSAILGFAAERSKITISDIRVVGKDCLYPSSPSLRLGLCASFLLLMAQLIMSFVGVCCICGKSRTVAPSKTKRVVGIVLAVVSWIAAVIGSTLFVEGAAWNANVARDTAPVCYFLKDGVFACAAVLALAATALGIASYVVLRGQPADDDEEEAAAPWKQPLLHGRIATGHPQFLKTTTAAAGPSASGSGTGREEPNVVSIKMDKTTIIVSSVVGSLGLLSAILGFAAEAAKSSDCGTTVGLAVTATIFLLMAQVTVGAAGGCCGCCKSRAIPSESKRIIGVVCASISWVAAVIAFALLVDGSIGAAVACIGLVGELAGAGVLVLVSTGLGITSLIMLRREAQADHEAPPPAPRGNGAYVDDEPTPIGAPMGVPMGVPGFPSPMHSNIPQAPAMSPNPHEPEPVPTYPPPYPPSPAAQGMGGGQTQAPANQQYPPPHPQGHGQGESKWKPPPVTTRTGTSSPR
uniref:Uncharacterized protein n=1 Tax=Leersia perrieri TaxID=77586 RepID=A0A0D9WGX0_9ORYZ